MTYWHNDKKKEIKLQIYNYEKEATNCENHVTPKI